MKRATLSRPSRLRATIFRSSRLRLPLLRVRGACKRERGEEKPPHEQGPRRRGSSPPDRTVDATIKARRNRFGPSWTILLVAWSRLCRIHGFLRRLSRHHHSCGPTDKG